MGGCRMGIRAEGAPAEVNEEAFCSGPGGLPREALSNCRRCLFYVYQTGRNSESEGRKSERSEGES